MENKKSNMATKSKPMHPEFSLEQIASSVGRKASKPLKKSATARKVNGKMMPRKINEEIPKNIPKSLTSLER